jgi:hypothetical protein
VTLSIKSEKCDMVLTVGGECEVSDGYHTFSELYEHRCTLWIALCRLHLQLTNKYRVNKIWRSKVHSDGTQYDGWFVLGMGSDGRSQITYHLPDSRWEECGFAEPLSQCPEFDGHTSADVLKRIAAL